MVIYMMVSGIIRDKGILLAAFLLLLSSCGSRRAANYNGHHIPVQVTDVGGRVIPSPRVSSRKAVPATWRDNVQARLDALCRQPLLETSQLGLYVYDLTDNMPLYTRNITQRMRPASNQKLVTGISALHFLGGDYTFRTDLRIRGSVAGGTLRGDVYVVGGMDPMLSPADLTAMAAALRKAGVSSVSGNLYADLSMKDDLPYGWGWCWDDKDGSLSALMVDAKDKFNTEWSRALTRAGIRCGRSGIKVQTAPADTRSVCCITHTMDEVLQPLLKNSQNIYAECLFYQIAAFSGQKNAGRKQAAGLINELIARLGLKPECYQIADGSGLSLYNYVTPELLVSLLNYAYGNPAIFRHLYPALPIAGVDGTLSKRMADSPACNNVHAKTGTLYGISTLAGYLTARNGHVLSFCIMNQGISAGREGRDFQDEVCTLLCE